MNQDNPPQKSENIPVTQKMLFEVRDELKSDIRSLGSRMESFEFRMESFESRMDAFDSRMDSLDSRMDSLDSRMDSLDSKIDSVNSKVDSLGSKMDSKFDKLLAEIHRVGLLVEDQNARNKYVLDGYTSLNDRIDRNQEEINEVKKTIESF